jgi:FlaA1/EpsC-like NDP-sugar epimerase
MSLGDFFRGKNFLVTGATGTVGRNLVDWLLETDLSRLCAIENNETAIYDLEVKCSQDSRVHPDLAPPNRSKLNERIFDTLSV